MGEIDLKEEWCEFRDNYPLISMEDMCGRFLTWAHLNPDTIFGIFVDRQNHARLIRDTIWNLDTAIPMWMKPYLTDMVKHKEIDRLRFNNNSCIFIFSDPIYGKGIALRHIAIWNNIKNIECLMKVVIPSLIFSSSSSIVRFE